MSRTLACKQKIFTVGKFDRSIKDARDLARKGDLTSALAAVDDAIAVARDAHLFRARLLQALGRPREALREVAFIDTPDASPAFLDMRAQLEEALDQFDAAIATLTRMLPLVKNRGPVLARRALLKQTLGQLDAALGDLDAAIALNPRDGELYRLRGGIVTYQKDDPAIEAMQKARAVATPGSAAAVQLDFAMAKALEDIGTHDAAFETLSRANRGMRALQPYDINARLRKVEAYRAAFAAGLPPAGPQATDDAPIFVTGMPRSGTTLIEQILSAHPQVTGGGEARTFLPHMTQHLGDPAAPPPGGLNLSAKALADLGHAYAADMQDRFGAAPRHTDKSMQTLLYAGAVLAALPKAHIVVVQRNPNAIALSLFKQVFLPGKQLFSYDLDDIRAYQRSFDEMVGFWADRLPDRFHLVAYEDVVAAPEPAIRALLDKVDLPFDPACLRPEDNNRAVKTPSAVAVRKPINTAPLEDWRKFAHQLGVRPGA